MRWEWRGYGPDPSEAALQAGCSVVHLRAPRMLPEVRLTLEEGRLVCARRESRDGELEGWVDLMSEDLPLPPWHTRELAKMLGPRGMVPVRALDDLDGVLKFLADLRSLGEPQALTWRGERTGSPEQGLLTGVVTIDERRFRVVRAYGGDAAWVRERIETGLTPGGVAELWA